MKMLEEVLGAVEIDPALEGKGDFKPKAPGMKYRHYAPQAAMYLFEGEAISNMLPIVTATAAQGIKTGGFMQCKKLLFIFLKLKIS